MSATPSSPTPDPAWSAVRRGEPAGRREFLRIGDVRLERGGIVPEVVVAVQRWGRLNAAADNAILVEHALTGDSHVVGSVEPGHPSPGWWDGLIGPGAPLDTDRYLVVASNVLGGCRGTTGPSTPDPTGRPWGSRFPFITIRDQVSAERAVADALGVRTWHAVLGGSMGGMRALEWCVTEPERVARAIVLASTAYATADQIAWCHPQLAAIRADPGFLGGDYYGRGEGPSAGLAIARSIAHTTYRAESELGTRFGRVPQAGEEPLGGRGRYAVESYLDHHGVKLGRRFDANSYLVLTEAMNSHDVGRDRGGLRAALSRFGGELVLAGVSSDRLYPLHLSEEMVRARPTSRLEVIESDYGHDGFLIETERVGSLIRSVVDS